MKLKREAHALYIKPSSTSLSGSAVYYLIGKGIDELSVSMNGDRKSTRLNSSHTS